MLKLKSTSFDFKLNTFFHDGMLPLETECAVKVNRFRQKDFGNNRVWRKHTPTPMQGLCLVQPA